MQLILDKNKMEDMLLKFSRTHFAKAEGTPFTTKPLGRLLAYDGMSAYGQKVSQGWSEIEHHCLDTPTKAILKNLKQKISPGHTQTHALNYESLLDGIKKWPERTMTSPLGRHLGIYKTLRKHVCEKSKKKNPDPDPKPPEKIQQGCNILYLIFDIMSLALYHAYPLQHWHTVWTFL